MTKQTNEEAKKKYKICDFCSSNPQGNLPKCSEKYKKNRQRRIKIMTKFQIIEQTGVRLNKPFPKSNPFKETYRGNQSVLSVLKSNVDWKELGVFVRSVKKRRFKVNM